MRYLEIEVFRDLAELVGMRKRMVLRQRLNHQGMQPLARLGEEPKSGEIVGQFIGFRILGGKKAGIGSAGGVVSIQLMGRFP